VDSIWGVFADSTGPVSFWFKENIRSETLRAFLLDIFQGRTFFASACARGDGERAKGSMNSEKERRLEANLEGIFHAAP
jgi:hypothetical protein